MRKTRLGWRLLIVGFFPLQAAATVISVDTLLDTDVADGQCSLREAIIAANSDLPYQDCPAGSGHDLLVVGITGTISIQAPLPTITESLTLSGPVGDTIVLDGMALRPVLTFDSPGDNQALMLRRVTLFRGYSTLAGGCLNSAVGDSLILEDVVIRRCVSEDVGGGLHAYQPASVSLLRTSLIRNEAEGAAGMSIQGDLDSPPPVSIIESVFARNDAFGADHCCGGAFLYGVIADIRRSTFSGNSALDSGAAMAVLGADVSLGHVTVTDNRSDSDDTGVGDGAIFISGDPQYIGILRSTNTIIAGNFATSAVASDLKMNASFQFHTEGYNLIGTNAGVSATISAGQPNVNGDWVGGPSSPLEPGLGGLANYGGPTISHLPEVTSPAIDRGRCPSEPWDQRGIANPETSLRTFDNPAIPNAFDGCDIGAVERSVAPLDDLLFSDRFE